MMCADCKFFEGSTRPGMEVFGECQIVLPPWILIDFDFERLQHMSRGVREDSECDFGRPREDGNG